MHPISLITLFALVLGALWFPVASTVVPPAVAAEVTGYGPIEHGSGWLLTTHRLYLTGDQGLSWQDVTPVLEGNAPLAADFVPSGRGWLVSGIPTAGDRTLLTLAQTSDFGRHWRSTRLSLFTVDDPDQTVGGLWVDFTSETEGALRVHHVTSSNFERWSEWRTTDGGETWLRTQLASGPSETVAEPTLAGRAPKGVFANPDVGWLVERTGRCTPNGVSRTCEQVTRLRATGDGGRTWRDVRLPEAVDVSLKWTVSEVSPSGAAIAGSSRTMIANGQGFDKCEVPTLQQLADWRSSSPYSAVNLYIGGIARSCKNSALSADYVRAMSNIGWIFIPTWVGPQAPCSGYKFKMSEDPAIARGQGQAEASAAVAVLEQLGLTEPDGSGSIVYYDMEHYSTGDASCNATVRSFIAGWNEVLQARGNLSGVYSTGSVLSLLANTAPPPNAVWIANWTDPSYNPAATVWNAGVSNSLWVSHQRLRQYAANPQRDPPETWTETWGDTTMSIDSNVLDGPVALAGPSPDTPTPTATPTATPTSTQTLVPLTPIAWTYLPLLLQQ